jgi:hypothetical protein
MNIMSFETTMGGRKVNVLGEAIVRIILLVYCLSPYE